MATIFSAEQLAQLVDETIPPEVAEHYTHVVVGTVDLDGAQIVVSFRKAPTTEGLNWELLAVGRHQWTGDTAVSGKVILKW